MPSIQPGVPLTAMPGTPVDLNGKSYRLQEGFQAENDGNKTAKAAKDQDNAFNLALHYSDFWTNPPVDLNGKSYRLQEGFPLQKALYNFTYKVMTTLKALFLSPEYISIGNEINDGVAGVTRGEEYYQLLQKGYEAVKAVSPETKVVIHLTVPNQQFYEGWIDDARKYGLNYDLIGLLQKPFWTKKAVSPETKVVIHLTVPNQQFYEGWIDDARKYGLNYDLIGASMYPFWTNMSIGEMANFVNHIAK
ncbi:hypothetical protein KAM622c_12590 [Klebsiella quasipneumoniae subsp. quasipneumoniae]|nr:hypothetical protein KAM622c_12590 [Klebsiella quasipneumoniae subsp. quasipneumoniae]